MEQTKQTHNLSKRLLSLLLAIIICFSFAPAFSFFHVAIATTGIPYDVFLSQNSIFCTVYASVSMLRSRAFLSGYSNYQQITIESGAGIVYTSSTNYSLIYSYTYSFNGNSISTNFRYVNGISEQELRNELKNHPEGVVIYDDNSTPPHAVLVYDYDASSNTFFCAENGADEYSGWQHCALCDSPILKKFSASSDRATIQQNILNGIDIVQFVSSYSISNGVHSSEALKNLNKFNETATSVDAYYKVTSKTPAVVRSSPYDGGNSNKIGTLEPGVEIHVTKEGKNTIQDHKWYYIGDGQFAGCYIYYKNVTKVTGCHHNYQQHYEADHPHRIYMKCTKCDSYYYTGATKNLSTCSECNPPVSNWFDDGTGFYAYIFKKDTWKALENRGGNVQLAQDGNDGYDPRQIWLFNRQSDGSYEIVNMYDNTCLDAADWGTSPGTNVGTHTKNDSTAQRWFLKLTSNDDVNIFPSYCNLALDVDGNYNDPGTNIKLWTYSDNTAQRYSIYKLDWDGLTYSKPAKPDAPSLSVKTVGTSDSKTTLQWTSSPLKNKFDKRRYGFSIHKGTSTSGTRVRFAATNDVSCSLQLEAGTYTAQVIALNTRYSDYYSAWSNAVTFTVPSKHTHTWDNGTVTKDATSDATGVRTYTCAECGETKNETIPARGTVTIHLNPNGGAGSMADVVVPYGESVTIPASTFTRTDYEPERTDYQQVGWVLYRHYDQKYNYGGNGWVDTPGITPNVIFYEEFYEVPGEWKFKVNPSWYNNNATDVTNAEFTLYAVWDYQYYTLSVDVTVDGEKMENEYDFATFDVSFNGRRLYDDVKSYWDPSEIGGFDYTVDDIKTSGCYTYTGKASYSGTITSDIHIDIPLISSHTWDTGKITKEPTCAVPGEKTFICSVCGTTKTEEIEITSDHTWDEGQITIAPTCAAPGEKTFTCSVCGTTRTEEIEITSEHTWDEGLITKAPTCAVPGERTFTCTICGTTRTETIPSPTHRWNDGEVTTPATCAATGVKTFTCSVCGTTRTETIEKTTSHSWDNGKVTTPATSTKEGVKTYTCSVCGATKTEPVPPTGDSDKPTIAVETVSAAPGELAEVKVSLANNPGINTFSLGFDYDTTNLQLKGVTVDPALGGQFTFKEKAVWLNAEDTAYNGTILTLTFAVAEHAEQKDLAVAVTYESGDIANLKEEDVSFQVAAGKIKVQAYMPGDINGDNKVNNKDLTRLMKYLAGDAVTVSANALDVNGDGKVNNKDLTRLMKYLAGDNVSIY